MVYTVSDPRRIVHMVLTTGNFAQHEIMAEINTDRVLRALENEGYVICPGQGPVRPTPKRRRKDPPALEC